MQSAYEDLKISEQRILAKARPMQIDYRLIIWICRRPFCSSQIEEEDSRGLIYQDFLTLRDLTRSSMLYFNG